LTNAHQPIASNQPTNKELSAYLAGQLSLFPKDSGHTNIVWCRSKVDFIELFSSVYECQSIKSTNHKKITKKEFIQLLMWFFNLNVGNWETTLSAAKSRKLERESPYLKELLSSFNNQFKSI
jgi:hypothetical protein